eukprot:147499-Rhodomonas_salina.3
MAPQRPRTAADRPAMALSSGPPAETALGRLRVREFGCCSSVCWLCSISSSSGSFGRKQHAKSPPDFFFFSFPVPDTALFATADTAGVAFVAMARASACADSSGTRIGCCSDQPGLMPLAIATAELCGWERSSFVRTEENAVFVRVEEICWGGAEASVERGCTRMMRGRV